MMTHINLTLSKEFTSTYFRRQSGNGHAFNGSAGSGSRHQHTEQVETDHYERTDDRKVYRNGYKCRNLTTQVGRIILRIPQIRDGKYSIETFGQLAKEEGTASSNIRRWVKEHEIVWASEEKKLAQIEVKVTEAKDS